MRLVTFVFLASAVIACGKDRPKGGDDDVDAGQSDAANCVGLECRIVNCAAMNPPQTNTTISGTVYAPNGTLALYGATVYIPNSDAGELYPACSNSTQCTEGRQCIGNKCVGATCNRCVDMLPGEPVARAISDEHGKFVLDNVPTGTDVPLIVQIGKWRRRVLIPAVTPCVDNPVPATLTSLPKNRLEGDLPKIAVTTGGCDALECLIRRLGVADGEFTSDTGGGMIHLYSAGGSTMSNGQTLTPATTLWGDLDKLKQYDIVMNSCQCSQTASEKTQAMMDNVKAYADLGGRFFGSHYHNVWIGGEYSVPTHAPAVWSSIATWGDGFLSPTVGIIDQVNNPKGSSFAMWMVNVMGSATPGSVAITEGRQTCNTLDNTKAERWVFADSSGVQYPQMIQFTAPLEAQKDMRCGKVVFSDMHVASGSFSSGEFPSGCSAQPLTPQEKALAFMFFDIANCVGVIF